MAAVQWCRETALSAACWSCEGAVVDNYFVIAVLGQMLGGVVMAVGVIVGLRLALPSLARTLARELETVRSQQTPPRPEAASRPVVTLEREE
jgi:hypothetical protein